LSQKSAVTKAVKAGAPIKKNGGASKKCTMSWAFSGGNKSTSSTWAQCETAAKVALAKGHGLGTKASGVAKSTKAFKELIATHSHECKHPDCRHLIKISTKTIGGTGYPNMSHQCLATNGTLVGGLMHYLCSTCHQTGRMCKDKVCRGLKCSRSRPDCAHLHDGSCTPRK